MSVDLRQCSMASAMAPVGCDWCGRLLSSRQRRWCSNTCMRGFQINHVWKYARQHALQRISPPRCIRCGSSFGLEVNHKVPLNGNPRTESCGHHQTNLEVLCHDCHVAATNEQRRAGFFQRRPR